MDVVDVCTYHKHEVIDRFIADIFECLDEENRQKSVKIKP